MGFALPDAAAGPDAANRTGATPPNPIAIRHKITMILFDLSVCIPDFLLFLFLLT
jgi:hypothetical protein